MSFTSLPFFGFFIVFLALYFVTHGRGRIAVCLLASYVYYAMWDWRFLSLILAATAVNYIVGLKLPAASSPQRRKTLLVLGLAFNLGLLGVFKYLGFFADSLSAVLGQIGLHVTQPEIRIILPLGISFYTFQNLSYIIDVYWARMSAERDLLRFATFVAFFPKIVAGPIVRASNFLPQLRSDRKVGLEQVIDGIELIAWGVFLKLVIADSLAMQVDLILGSPEKRDSLSLAIGLFFYTFQIYSDFNGYSSIAIGIGRMLGFDFGINFDRPYFSASFSEFWKRWHISLSSWIKDYLYIPLGGSRGGRFKTYRNLIVAMSLCGVWHGASWNFALWGALHGVYLVLQRIMSPLYAAVTSFLRVPSFVSKAFLMALVFALTAFAWLFFRVPDFHTALYIISRILSFHAHSLAEIPNKLLVVKGMALIGFLTVFEALSFRVDRRLFDRVPLFRFAGLLFLLLSISLFGTFQGHSFIYGGF